MPRTYEPIASQTLGSDAATVTFSSIPSTFTDLILVCSVTAENLRNALLRLNGDTATNYSTTWLAGYGTSSVASSRASNDTLITGPSVYSGFSSTNPAVLSWQIMSYANTNVFKTALIAGGLGSTEVNRHVGLWRSTSAVTSVGLLLNGSGNFKTGSTFSLFGIKAA